MKNSDFLSWFNNLNSSNTKENILSSANNIISSLSIEEEKTIVNKEKYKYYLKVFNTQSEDLLYTINRLIGGICSTAIELRKGFGIALQLFLDKFISEINLSELLEGIQKETYVPKHEKNNIRLAALSGKLLIFNKIFNEYFDIKKNKINKLLEGIFKSFDTILEHKNNLTLIDNNLEFCTYFILMDYIDNIKGFLPSKLIEDFFDNNNEESNQPLFKYFCLLLNLPIKYQNINTKDANVFNYSLK